MKTLPLNSDWDLVLTNGDLVLAEQHTSIAQDVASACRTFLGEQWYNRQLGVPYFQLILGQLPPASLVQKKLEQQALLIQDTTSAKALNLQLGADRKITGNIVVTSIYTSNPIVVNV